MVSLLLRVMLLPVMLLRVIVDSFLTRISILVPGSGTAYHTRILDPPESGGCPLLPLAERVDDPHPVHLPGVLHVFRKQNAAAGLLRGAKNQGIPKRQPMKPVKVDGGKNVRDLRGGHIELRQ